MDTSWDPMVTSIASPANTSGSGRTIVLCFDGTENAYCDKNTNIVQLFSFLKVSEPDKQICYYQPGVGTYYKAGVVSPIFETLAKWADFGVAWYLDDHVMQGYQFLINNYNPNDVICVFGFSRGAYTARALAGLVAKIGILPRNNDEQVTFAYKLYKRTDAQGIRLAAGFKKTFSVNPHVKVDFVGVWDTVAFVGFTGKSLPFTNTNTDIKIFRHALSLDEHRACFRPNLYHFPSPNQYRDPQKGSSSSSAIPVGTPEPNVREVWFAGCHNDVGSGSVENTAPYSLGYISLAWMVQEIKASGLPILFHDHAATVKSTDASDARSQEIYANEAINAVQEIHDPLFDPLFWWLWWILEFLAFNYYWQDSNFKWHNSRIPNFGRARWIPTAKPLFHVSVAERIGDEALSYRPRAHYIPGSETYVR
jgi:uncharacterized protein (DUF2235 family)